MSTSKDFKRLHILFEPDLLEALTQECRRLEIPRATLVKALCREFILDAENKVQELRIKELLRKSSDE